MAFPNLIALIGLSGVLARLVRDYDQRLPEMLFRYRARNWPETLSADERERWEEYRQARLNEPDGGGSLQMDDYLAILDQLEMDEALPEDKRRLVPQLLAWAEQVG